MCEVYMYHIHLARDSFAPVVPEHGDAADADGHRPREAHHQTRHQLRHVAAVVQRVHYRYVPANMLYFYEHSDWYPTQNCIRCIRCRNSYTENRL